MYRLCLILCILCKSAASDSCFEKNLSKRVREKLKRELSNVNAEYNCELEYELADDIAWVKAYYGDVRRRSLKKMKKLIASVKRFEHYFYKVKGFKSEKDLLKNIQYVKGIEGKHVGCVHLRLILRKNTNYICFIEKETRPYYLF